MKKTFFLLAVTFFFLQACSVRLPSSIVSSFDQCRLDQVEPYFQKELSQGGKNLVLYRYALVSTFMRQGQRKQAIAQSLQAQQLIWSDVGQAQGLASLASAESLKIFKGEPFERMMNSLYLGILLTQEGDFDNARAAFAKARLAIAQNSSVKKSYSATSEFLFAKLLAFDKQTDNAKIALKNAQAIYPSNQTFNEANLSHNVIFVVEQGRSPEKYRTGPGDSLVGWRPQHNYFPRPRIAVNQKELLAYESDNLYVLATTKESSTKDTIQNAKGLARELGAITTVIAADQAARRKSEAAGWVALGAGLFTVLNQSEADIRQWEFLPERLYVTSAMLPKGVHQFSAGDRLRWQYEITDESKPVIFWIPGDMCLNTNLWENKKETK